MIYIETLLKILINTYLLKARCLLVFSNNLNLNNISMPVVNLNNELLPKKVFRNYGCRDIIIDYNESQEIFENFERLLRLQWERYNTRRYVIIWRNNSGNSVQQFFQLDENDHVCDILLITLENTIERDRSGDKYEHFYNRIDNRNEIYEFFTHQYGGNEKPRRVLLLDKWFSENSSFLYSNNLFPEKLTKLSGRNYVIATMDYRPYSVADHANGIFDGIETRLLFEFFKKYNSTGTFLKIADYNWGDVYPNGTADGILGNVALGKADIGFAGIFLWEKFYKYLDFSKHFLRVGMTVIAPAPKPASGWLIPILPFSTVTWAILSLSFISCTFTLFMILRFSNCNNLNKKFDYSLTTLIEAHLLQSINIISGGNLYKYFLGIILLEVLILTSSYSSGLSSVMTIPRYKHAISTLQDLADSDLEWGNTDISFVFAIDEVNYGPYPKIKSNFRVHTESELGQISKTFNFAFTVERLPFGQICVGKFIKRNIIDGYRIMHDDLYWDETVFVLRKHSVLLPLLNDLIMKVYESGLQAYWEREVVDLHMDFVIQEVLQYYNTRHKPDNQEPVKLQWLHVQGPFGILFGGLLLATLCFLGELVAYRRKRGKNSRHTSLESSDVH